jgi:hypothetical protein
MTPANPAPETPEAVDGDEAADLEERLRQLRYI